MDRLGIMSNFLKTIFFIFIVVLPVISLGAETGSSNQVLRVPPGGGRPKFGQIKLDSAAAVSGSLPISNGGTGQSTKEAAFNALSPITNLGDMILGSGENSATRIPIGINGQVWTVNSSSSYGAEWSNPRLVYSSSFVDENYTAKTTDDVLFLRPNNDESLNVTLYTAVGNKGRTLHLKKDNFSDFPAIIKSQTGQIIGNLNSIYLSGNNEKLVVISDGLNWKILSHSSPPIFIRDQKASGTSGGTGVANAWTTRVLNTSQGNTVLGTLGSNRFSLKPGSYIINGSSPFFSHGSCKIRLRNITDNITTLVGSNMVASNSSGYGDSRSHLSGIFSINDYKTFEIQYYCNATSSGGANALGSPVSSGEPEIYTELRIDKVEF